MITQMEREPEVKALNELQLMLNLMSYIAADLKEISCLESFVLFDEKLKTVFCESKNEELRNTKDHRGRVEDYLNSHRKLQMHMKETLKTGVRRKFSETENRTVLILPIIGMKKPIGLIGITYRSDGCLKENCAADLIFADIIRVFTEKYREMKEREEMTSMGCRLKTLEDYEKYAILETGRRCNWNITFMAKELSIGRNTLYSKMKKLGIS